VIGPLALRFRRRRLLALIRRALILGAVALVLSAMARLSFAQNQNYPNVFNSILGNVLRQMPPPAYQPSYRPAPAYQPAVPNYQQPAYQPPPPQPQNQYYQEGNRPSPKRSAPVATESTPSHSKADKEALEAAKSEMKAKGLVDQPQDITVLIVAHDTQDITRNLAGDPQFSKPANVCFPFKTMSTDLSTPEGRFYAYVSDKVKRKGGGSITSNQCDLKNFGQFDILAFSLDQLDFDTNPALKPDIIQAVLAAYKDGAFKDIRPDLPSVGV
jgi:hypothetical protein